MLIYIYIIRAGCENVFIQGILSRVTHGIKWRPVFFTEANSSSFLMCTFRQWTGYSWLVTSWRNILCRILHLSNIRDSVLHRTRENLSSWQEKIKHLITEWYHMYNLSKIFRTSALYNSYLSFICIHSFWYLVVEINNINSMTFWTSASEDLIDGSKRE